MRSVPPDRRVEVPGAQRSGLRPGALGDLLLALICGAVAVFGVSLVGSSEAMLAVMGVAACALIFMPSHVVFAVCLLVFLFNDSIARVSSVSAIGWADEACLIILVVNIILWSQSRNRRGIPPELWYFGAFAALGLVSGVLAGVSSMTLALGCFLVIKPLLFLWCASRLVWTEDVLALYVRGMVALAAFVTVCCIINFVAPAPWTDFVVGYVRIDQRFGGLPSLVGPFVHPSVLAFVAGAISILSAAYMSVRGLADSRLSIVLITFVLSILSFRRRLMIGLGLALMATFSLSWGTGVVLVIAAFALVALVLVGLLGGTEVIFGPFLDLFNEYVSGGDKAARTRLTIDSFSVASEHFPLGAGFGRFGSAMAREHYSPEYVRLGYQDIWGLSSSPGSGNFLTDTQWPAILGESGFFGTVAFICGLLVILRRFWILRGIKGRDDLDWPAIVGTAGVGIFVFSLVDSIAQPTFSGSSGIWLFAMAGIAYSMARPGSGYEMIDEYSLSGFGRPVQRLWRRVGV